MLVLSRKKDEEIILKLPSGEIIRIVVNALSGERVKLAFDAPKDIPIWRGELQEKTLQPN